MRDYPLRYDDASGSDERCLSFQALSLESALEFAKRNASANWAELSEDGVPICRMQLVDSSGLWRVSRISPKA